LAPLGVKITAALNYSQSASMNRFEGVASVGHASFDKFGLGHLNYRAELMIIAMSEGDSRFENFASMTTEKTLIRGRYESLY
jgi:hypothetical protein